MLNLGQCFLTFFSLPNTYVILHDFVVVNGDNYGLKRFFLICSVLDLFLFMLLNFVLFIFDLFFFFLVFDIFFLLFDLSFLIRPASSGGARRLDFSLV